MPTEDQAGQTSQPDQTGQPDQADQTDKADQTSWAQTFPPNESLVPLRIESVTDLGPQ